MCLPSDITSMTGTCRPDPEAGNARQERGYIVSRVFITGSADGLGLAAATLLLSQGHEGVGPARNAGRASDRHRAVTGLTDVAVGDLSSAAETKSVADQVNALGRFDAVIHNA